MNSYHYAGTLKSLNVGLHDNTKLHTSVCTTETITDFGCTVFPLSLYSPQLTPTDYHLGPLKNNKTYKNTITPVMRHWRMLCTSGCSGARTTFPGQQNMPFSNVEEDCQQ